MGALTTNRKRGEDYFNSNHKLQPFYSAGLDFRVDNHVSKKPKFSPLMPPTQNRSIHSKYSISRRIQQYPEHITPIKREVHAPCVHKFGFAIRSRPSTSQIKQREVSTAEMGNFLGLHNKLPKKRALDTMHFKREKQVIDVDEETVQDESVSEDSSVEEVEVAEDDGLEDYTSSEAKGILAKYRELDGNDAFAQNRDFHLSSSVVSDLTNGKILESLSQNRELDVSLHYKVLLGSAEKRDDKLRRLSFEIELNEKRRATQQLFRPAKKEKDTVSEAFLPVTKDEVDRVTCAFSKSSWREVLVTHENSNIEITGEVLQCLKPGAWLNDEVINVYLELLKEREKREPQNFLKCHFFSTFFYKKLISGRNGYDYKSVRRWTTQRKLGYCLYECDKIFVPVHKEIHWCLAIINKKDEKFQYLDSLGGVDKKVMRVLAKYFVDEVKDKSGKDIDVTSWKQEYVKDLPNQENGFDCGVFMIKYADFYSRDIGLCFNQEHMPYFRVRTAKEILRLRAD